MKMVKKLMAGCLVVAMVLTGIVVTPVTAEATEETGVHYDTTSGYKINNYWSESKKTAPAKAGFVFGGWYQKSGDSYVPLKEADLSDEVVKTIENVYPKFVPAGVLSVKSQVGKYTENEENKRSLRIISTVDSSKYSKVGFEYVLGDDGTIEAKRVEMTKIYTGIKLSKDATETVEPGNVFVAGASNYFIAFDVDPVQETSFGKIVYARPYWVTMDGTEVMGLARNSRVEDNDGEGTEYLSVPVSLLTDGRTPAEVAAGKVIVTYNKDKFAVDKVETGRIFAEMGYYVDTATGTVTFVGNVDKAENVTADGLYANIRFTKTDSTATNSDLDFAVDSKQFCNWAEKLFDDDALTVQ